MCAGDGVALLYGHLWPQVLRFHARQAQRNPHAARLAVAERYPQVRQLQERTRQQAGIWCWSDWKKPLAVSDCHSCIQPAASLHKHRQAGSDASTCTQMQAGSAISKHQEQARHQCAP